MNITFFRGEVRNNYKFVNSKMFLIPVTLSIIAIAGIIFYNYSVAYRPLVLQLNGDVLKEIFAKLELKQVMNISSVCKEWYKLANDDLLIKKLIYQKNAINPVHLNKFFGSDTITSEEIENAFESLPVNIYEILKNSNPAFLKKMIMDTHTLVWIPKTIKGKPLTINTFRGLLKQKQLFPVSDGYQYIWHKIVNQMGEKPVTPGFVLMSRAVLPGSTNKTYAEQKILVCSMNRNDQILLEIPTLIETIICIHLNYLKTGEFNFNDKPLMYTRCNESIDDFQLIVGAFDSSGLYIGSCENIKRDYIGMGSLILCKKI